MVSYRYIRVFKIFDSFSDTWFLSNEYRVLVPVGKNSWYTQGRADSMAGETKK